MTEFHNFYSQAPIAEAVLDIRTTFLEEATPEAITAFAKKWVSELPISENLNLLSMGIQGAPALGAGLNVQQDQQFIGIRLIEAQRQFMVQVRRDGFAFIRMGQYPGWNDFKLQAQLWWQRYCDSFPIKGVTRAALRYINRIEIPGLQIDPEDYFHLYLHVPEEGCLKDVVGFALRAGFPQNDIGATALIQQTMTQPTKPQHLAIMLDIDLYSVVERGNEDEELWTYFDVLRARKNLLFENAITDRTREIIR